MIFKVVYSLKVSAYNLQFNFLTWSIKYTRLELWIVSILSATTSVILLSIYSNLFNLPTQ